MSATYVYEVKFYGEETQNIASLMKEKGLLRRNDPNPDFKVSCADLSRTEDWERYEKDGEKNVFMREEGNSLFYGTKWSPDDRVSDCLSKMFPDKVLEVIRTYDNAANALWYEKNGKLCNKEGEELSAAIPLLHSNLVKKCENGRYRVRFNLGEKGWRSVFFSEKDVEPITYVYNGTVETSGYLIMFSSDEVATHRTTINNMVENVSNEEKMLTADFLSLYYAARERYKEDMNKQVSIEGLPRSAFKEMRGGGNIYYLVDIPVSTDVVTSGSVTVAISSDDVSLDDGKVMLGSAGYARRATTLIGENARREEIKIANKNIVAGYEKTRPSFTVEKEEEASEAKLFPEEEEEIER